MSGCLPNHFLAFGRGAGARICPYSALTTSDDPWHFKSLGLWHFLKFRSRDDPLRLVPREESEPWDAEASCWLKFEKSTGAVLGGVSLSCKEKLKWSYGMVWSLLRIATTTRDWEKVHDAGIVSHLIGGAGVFPSSKNKRLVRPKIRCALYPP